MMSKDYKNHPLFRERISGRAYLRLTRLSIVIIIALIVIPVMVLTLLFLTRPSVDDRKIDVNVRPLPSAEATPETVIKQAPPRPLPTIRQPPVLPKPSPSIISSSPFVESNKQPPTQNLSKPPAKP